MRRYDEVLREVASLRLRTAGVVSVTDVVCPHATCPPVIDGVLVRDWDPNNRHTSTGLQMGMRLYEIEGVRFARVRFLPSDHLNCWGLDFLAVSQADYRRLYKIALRCRDEEEPPSPAPVLPQEQLDQLWNNTIGYLERANLERINHVQLVSGTGDRMRVDHEGTVLERARMMVEEISSHEATELATIG